MSSVAKKAGIKFKQIGAPQPEEVIDAKIKMTLDKVSKVNP